MPIRRGTWLPVVALLAWLGPAGAGEMNPPLPTGKVLIAGRVAVTVELARSAEEQIRGLSNRPELRTGHGMLFLYDSPRPVGIWMKDMRFPLDIIWIREGRVIKIEKHAPPLVPGSQERVYMATADLVLEVPAGFTEQQMIRVGDSTKLVFR
jgi:hypothetical protein